jgi:hypothetical protein
MSRNHNIIDDRIDDLDLDRILTEASEGYGDLVAASVVHNVSVRALRSRLRHNQELEKPACSPN